MAEFSLHPQLKKDCFLVTDLPLCRVLLMDNALFPWTILVPRIGGLKELFDVPPQQQAQLWAEIEQVHNTLQELTNADKMNVGALGNMVPQLHIHVIARTKSDAAWPAPVWGKDTKPYKNEEIDSLLERLRAELAKF